MATIDLRCDGTLHGRLTDNRWLEVKCKRRACGHGPGTIVLHTIDITTGTVVSTKRFGEPNNKETSHAPAPRTPVRAPRRQAEAPRQ